MKKDFLKVAGLVPAVVAALVVASLAFGQVAPTNGISQAQLPLKRVGRTVVLTTNGTIKGSSGSFGSLVVGSCTGCGGGGGGSGGSIAAYSQTNGALVTATPRASWSGNTVPTSTDGTLIVHKSVTATAGHRYLVLAQAQMNMDAAATNTALWISTNSQPAQSVTVFTISQSYAATQTVLWIDTSMGGTIDFQLWGTPDASNGGDFRTNVYQAGGDKVAWAAKSATAIRVIDLDSGGGGGSQPDPATFNAWTPSSGSGTVNGNATVTGNFVAQGVTDLGLVSMSHITQVTNITSTGTVKANILETDGAIESVPGASIQLIPPSGKLVRIETTGTQPTCASTTAGGLWYQSGAGAGNTHLQVCLCGTIVLPACSWVTIATH